MAGRSPARFLAPLALVAFAVALLLVISGGSGSGSGSSSSVAPKKTSSPASAGGTHKKHHRRRTYVVKAGDTPSAIADKTGVPLATLFRLNPDLDPQTLAPGQKIKLRR
jgi:LysM repeat protein